MNEQLDKIKQEQTRFIHLENPSSPCLQVFPYIEPLPLLLCSSDLSPSITLYVPFSSFPCPDQLPFFKKLC